MRRFRWLWIVLLGFGCACLTVFAVIGGVLTLGVLTEGKIEVQVEPAVLTVGTDRETMVTLNLINPDRREAQVSSIAIPNPWWEVLPVVRSEPPFVRIEDGLGERLLIFENLVVPAQGAQTLRLWMKPLQAGRYSEEWTLNLANGDLVLFRMEALVQPPQAVSATSTPETITAATPTTPPLENAAALAERLARSVVMIVALKIRPDGTPEPVWSGSGTVVDPRGFILTNAHVVLDDLGQPVDDLLILVTQQPDQPPEPAYRARVIQADPKLDLAVIKIDRDADGNPLPQSPDLPAVPLGDSDQLRLGDPLLILGYPGIGGETITLTRGEVSGFTSQPGYGPRAWIKTSATIAGGSSGGLAANLQGELVGIPSLVGAGDTEEVVDCRPLVDTNNDGVIDEQDTCVPIGGYINALRPVNLAKPLIQAALTGQVALPTPRAPETRPDLNLQEVFYESFDDPVSGYWLEEQNENGFSRYEQGRFLVGVNQDQFLFWFSYQEQVLQDMAVTVTVQVKRRAGDGDVGVLCREDPNTGDFYAFSVSEDGYYSIWMFHQGEYQALVKWTPLPNRELLRPGREVQIGAICLGPHLALLIDGEVVDEVRDDTLKRGYGGFLLGTWQVPGLTVAFDDFYVYEIQP